MASKPRQRFTTLMTSAFIELITSMEADTKILLVLIFQKMCFKCITFDGNIERGSQYDLRSQRRPHGRKKMYLCTELKDKKEFAW